jgi:starch synthase (maltosyl-transferring)
VLYWVDVGVRTFRVDNPHTKPLPFWQWLIADIRARHPEVLFLSEAFTRPSMMYRLAKIGFAQSYTYFIWRNSKRELTEYFTELTTQAPKDFFRPHLFVNTPDINPYFLQSSGRAGFLIRSALAATLSGLWGMYSGFELCEAAPLPGREEYMDSEKYQIKQRDWQAPGNIIAEISRLNQIRRTIRPCRRTSRCVSTMPGMNRYCGTASPPRDWRTLSWSRSAWIHTTCRKRSLKCRCGNSGCPTTARCRYRSSCAARSFNWYGKIQHWRFVPQEMPFAIFRVQPWRQPA